MIEQPKSFKTYEEQVDLLIGRGMCVADRERAIEKLRRVNYYRLSGYWYPFRMRKPDGDGRSDRFLPGSAFDDVVALYDFDARLRVAVLAALAPVELSMRALIGHALGKVDPSIHLNKNLLGYIVRGERASEYNKWLKKYNKKIRASREEFVQHHNKKYKGILPIWVAVEVLDWGMLTHLYSMSPDIARDEVASMVNLTPPQLHSWLKALNVVRNIAAHHGRMYNQVYGITPKMPSLQTHPEVCSHAGVMNRIFGQATLIQYLLRVLKVGNLKILPSVFRTFPENEIVPFGSTGAPGGWFQGELWKL
ncbi:Abi-like protein [Actinomyces naeslundii]|uniref:Abi family protein n=1 Tax=Actinomyces naeslundii TaxID=1655 RepID=UPI001A596871|nr:Abi family protein [Actinomyces naeslundii]VTX78625.1 Abi-like protein [Actinomyces naeslundii]